MLLWLGWMVRQFNDTTPMLTIFEDWEYSYDVTPPFGSGEWRIKPKKSPVEEAGITKEDLLAYFDKYYLSNNRNGLILRLNADDGTDVPKCEVVVGNSSYFAKYLVWCHLSNLKKIFP